MDRLTRYSADEFKNEIRPRLFGFSENSIKLIELFFVQGLSLKAASDECGVVKQSGNQTLNRAIAVLNGYPKDWVSYTGYMPAEMATEIRSRIAKLIDQQKKTPR